MNATIETRRGEPPAPARQRRRWAGFRGDELSRAMLALTGKAYLCLDRAAYTDFELGRHVAALKRWHKRKFEYYVAGDGAVIVREIAP